MTVSTFIGNRGMTRGILCPAALPKGARFLWPDAPVPATSGLSQPLIVNL